MSQIRYSLAKKTALCLSVVMTFALCLTSCGTKSVPEPKPMGYFRIELPEHQYALLDTTLPFSFEKSTKAEVEIIPQKDKSTWLNVKYPDLDASFRFTCLNVANADSLRRLMISEDKMVKFHYKKAEDVQYSIIRDTNANLWGQIYEIYGKDVATPFQFWVTDSSHRFVRATLYFDCTPNNDSLQPVIDYLKEDGMHLIKTFMWK